MTNTVQINNSYGFDWNEYRKCFNEVKAKWGNDPIVPKDFLEQLDSKLVEKQIFNRKQFVKFLCLGCGDPQKHTNECKKSECKNIIVIKKFNNTGKRKRGPQSQSTRLELSDFCPNRWFAVPMSFF